MYYHLPAYSVSQVRAAIKEDVGEMFVSKGTTSIYSIPFSADDIRADPELQQGSRIRPENTGFSCVNEPERTGEKCAGSQNVPSGCH
jgi:hypothetical protein